MFCNSNWTEWSTMGPLQLGSRDHNFPKIFFILWAIT